jgi:hypothetical protein
VIAERLLTRLDQVKSTGQNRWKAVCPSHDDGTPSLSISDVGDLVLIHCFAGCESEAILAAVGLTYDDLYPPRILGHALKPKKIRLISSIQALEIVAKEALLICVIASQLARGERISDQEKDRLFFAAGRINEAYRTVL